MNTMDSKKGYFLTFEGPEGAGKSTQLQRAAEFLRSRGIEVVTTREPGGTPLAEKLREILKTHHGKEKLHPETELLLMEAARSQHVHELILPALERGAWVLCDRFYDSTSAYQGVARSMGLELISRMNRFAAGAAVPDRTLIFDLPVESGFARTRKRESTSGEYDRFEAEALDFHRKVRQAFLDLAAAEPARFRVINADQTPDRVTNDMERVLDELLC